MAMAAGNAGGCAAVGTTLTSSNQTTPIAESGSFPQIHFDPHNANRFLFVYQDWATASLIKCAVGTVTSSGFTFGSFYSFQTERNEKPSVAWNPNVANQFLIAYVSWESAAYANYGDVRIGTITSSTVISFSSSVTFHAAGTGSPKVVFDPNSSGDLIVAFTDATNSGQATVRCATLSGGTLTFASNSYALSTYGISSDSVHGIAYDSKTAGKFALVLYKTSDYYGYIVVGTISSQVVTFGAPYAYDSTGTNYYAGISADPFTADKFVIASGHWSGTSAKVLIATVSGYVPTFGTTVSFYSGKGESTDVQYSHTNENKIVIVWQNDTNGHIKTRAGTIAGSVVTLGTTITPYAGSAVQGMVNWDYVECGKYIVAHRIQGGSYYPQIHQGEIT
jgi:hypothetical protein